MNSKKIKLINGPHDGREIKDRGAVVIRMSLSTNGETLGATIGDAFYEPNDDRTLAFWNGNVWLGTLNGVIPA